jgi:hypothetical protein
MMWSKHSRRIDPINRSAKPFCQGVVTDNRRLDDRMFTRRSTDSHTRSTYEKPAQDSRQLIVSEW